MKVILAFFIGLLTGVIIILGPLVAMIAYFAINNDDEDKDKDEPVVGNPGVIRYSSMPKPQTPEENPS